MALPGNFSTVPVHGKYLDLAGVALAGTVTFTATPDALTDPAALVIIMRKPLVVTLDVNGEFTTNLPATDDPDIDPIGFTYKVVESFPGRDVDGREYYITVPVASLPGGIDLTTAAPAVPVDGVARGQFLHDLADVDTTGAVTDSPLVRDSSGEWVAGPALSATYSTVVSVTTVASAGSSRALTAPSHGAKAYDITGSTTSCALTFSGGTAGEECAITLYLRQDSTGSRAWTFPAAVHWPGGITPTFSPAANTYDIVVLTTLDGGSTFDATLAGSALVSPSAAGAPSGLAVSAGDTLNSLSWTQGAANGSAVTQNQIWRGTSSGSETLLATVSAATSYSDTGLTNGTAYYYKVKAVNGIGTSGFSGEASGTPVSSTAHYLNLPGTSGANATTPSGTANNLTADLDLRVHLRLTDYTPAATQSLFGKWGALAAAQQYLGYLTSDGKLNLGWNDATFKSFTSSVATGLTDGTDKWIRFTIDNSSPRQVRFWLADSDTDDGSTYTQLGTTGSVASGAIQTTTSPLVVGDDLTAGENPANGRIYRFRMFSGGVQKVDINFAGQTPGSTSFAGATGETWTVNSTASIV